MGTIALWWETGLPNKHPLLAPFTPGARPFVNEGFSDNYKEPYIVTEKPHQGSVNKVLHCIV